MPLKELAVAPGCEVDDNGHGVVYVSCCVDETNPAQNDIIHAPKARNTDRELDYEGVRRQVLVSNMEMYVTCLEQELA
jgi:hypothetical protein